MSRGWGALAGAALLIAAPAQAQLVACALPDRLPVPRADLPSKTQPRRAIPIAAYTLALSWSPEHCRTARRSDAFQCGATGNRFGFILHGLWPDGAGRDWPQYCRATSLLPPAILRANLCMTPSVDLLQGEWARHGTCMSRTPQRYFAQGRALFERVQFPDMTRLAANKGLTVGVFTDAFLAANRHIGSGLSRRSVRIRLDRAGWLEEVWLCLDTRLRHARCGAAQSGGAAYARAMKILIRR